MRKRKSPNRYENPNHSSNKAQSITSSSHTKGRRRKHNKTEASNKAKQAYRVKTDMSDNGVSESARKVSSNVEGWSNRVRHCKRELRLSVKSMERASGLRGSGWDASVIPEAN